MVAKPFALDVVLKVRKRKEDVARQRLFQAQHEEKAVEAELQENIDLCDRIILQLEDKQAEGMLAVELERFEETIFHMHNQIRSLEKKLRDKKQITKNKRSTLLKKSQEYNILLSLKDKQDRNWKHYLDKKEANMLDEIAILHHERAFK